MEADLAKTVKKACVVCAQEYADEQDVCPFDGTKLTVIGQELSPGVVLGGRYEILAVVADGGMGKVYKARHKLMNRTVAVKTMLPAMVASGTALKRFQQEAEAVSLLNHPNVLTIFDFFISDDGQPYLVMDYLEGTNLQELQKNEGAIPAPRVLPIFIMACSGLAHAHERGIVHRDIKPANLMLVNFDGKSDFVKIIDFGIAKLSPSEGGERSRLTTTGDVFGSAQYMSPEQCHAKPLDARSDIYSLGCSMYATLSGTAPFSGDPMECMYKHVYGELPLLEDAFPDLDFPTGLQEIIARTVEKDPENRFQSMNELKAAVQAVHDRMLGTGGNREITIPIGELSVEQVMANLKEAAGDLAPTIQEQQIPTLPDVQPAQVAQAAQFAPLDRAAQELQTAQAAQGVQAAQSAKTIPSGPPSAAKGQRVYAPFGISLPQLSKRAVWGVGAVSIVVAIIVVASVMYSSPKTARLADGKTAQSGASQAPVAQVVDMARSPGLPAPNNSSPNPAIATSTSASNTLPGPPASATPTANNSSLSSSVPGSPTPVATPPTSRQIFDQNFKQGVDAYKSGDYPEAQKYFHLARAAASEFGQSNPRYLDSVEWQGKTAYQLGHYQEAKQALEWVLYARKAIRSPQVAQTQKELSMVRAALKQR